MRLTTEQVHLLESYSPRKYLEVFRWDFGNGNDRLVLRRVRAGTPAYLRSWLIPKQILSAGEWDLIAADIPGYVLGELLPDIGVQLSLLPYRR